MKKYRGRRPNAAALTVTCKFYESIKDGDSVDRVIIVELTEGEVGYLQTLIFADLKMRKDLRSHAISHGDVGYIDSDLNTAKKIINKMHQMK